MGQRKREAVATMRAQVERRRFRRAEMEISVTIRPAKTAAQGTAAVVGQVRDVSLAGVYCYVQPPCSLSAGDVVTCSVEIPPEASHAFPFSRVQGRGWVIRAEAVNPGRREDDLPQGGEPLVGVAISFAPDVTALATLS